MHILGLYGLCVYARGLYARGTRLIGMYILGSRPISASLSLSHVTVGVRVTSIIGPTVICRKFKIACKLSQSSGARITGYFASRRCTANARILNTSNVTAPQKKTLSAAQSLRMTPSFPEDKR